MARVDKEDQIMQVFSVSNNAARSIDHHAHEIGKEHLQIGVSKERYIHNNKADYLRENGLAADKRLSIGEKGQISQLHSWGQYHKFCSCTKNFFTYARAEYGIKDFRSISPEVAKSFVNALADMGYSRNTVNGYISQLEKYGSFTGQGREFQAAMKDFRGSEAFASLENKATQTRAYDNPGQIIGAIKQVNASNQTIEKASLVATLELKYGLRTDDACHFRLVGDNQIFFNSKNGMKTLKTLAPEHIAQARSLAQNGKFDFSVNTMKDIWSKACEAAGVKNHGQHGLRHNFAQASYNECRARGRATVELS